MTELELSQIDPKNEAEASAQFTLEAWESRFPDVLSDDGRHLLYLFILNALEEVGRSNRKEG